MRILSVQASNFASYKELSFNTTDQGLTLVHGPTGSGKSTLCDIIPWCLFGTTAKNGSVDEVLSWPGGLKTTGVITFDFGGSLMTITRIRGPNAKDNDLYYEYDHTLGAQHRGANLNDTQAIINKELRCDAGLYLSGAYFHEFSQTASFFITTAKNRRNICEQIVDLSLAKKLQTNISETSKQLKKQSDGLEREVATLAYAKELLVNKQKSECQRANNWQQDQEKKIKSIDIRCDNFEIEQTKRINELIQLHERDLEDLKKATICSECGAPKAMNRHATSPYADKIKYEAGRENPYVDQLISLVRETNPYIDGVKDYTSDINTKDTKLKDCVSNLTAIYEKLADLSILDEVATTYRSVTIQTVIKSIEANTNKLLISYFDGEISVEFETEAADKIDVKITKDGHQCAYTQLSKGQRQLLKLCFSVSIMSAVSNHSGINFSQIFLDEALDGLDDSLKVKAYRLLEALSIQYESIFVVEHNSALKELFPNKLKIHIVEGHSQIEES